MFRSFGFLFLFVPYYLFADDFFSVHEDFKRGNYESVCNSSKKELLKQSSSPDPRFLYLYVVTEKDWKETEKTFLVYRQSGNLQSKFYFQALYQFLERLFVLGEMESLLKWGKIFQKEAKNSSKYHEGLFLLSFALKELQNPKEALTYLSEIEQTSSNQDLLKKVQSWKETWK